MDMTEIFSCFDRGALCLPGDITRFGVVKWVPHSVFEGVELKHLVKGGSVKGLFSYHLVRIAPGRKIGMHVHEAQVETHEVMAGSGTCINDGVVLAYVPGVVSVFAANTPHEIVAGEEELFLFAKFFPALC